MNSLLQNILVFAALAFAVLFLVRKFLWKKAKSKKTVGDHHDCDNCH